MRAMGWLLAGVVAMTGAANASGPVLTREDYDRAARMLAHRTVPLVDDVAWLTDWNDAGGTRWIVKTRDGVEIRRVDADGKATVVGRVAADALRWNERGSLKFSHEGRSYTCGFGAGTCAPQIDTPDPKPGDGPASRSPDGQHEVFIRNWNLWLRDVASGKETPITTDGVENYGYATDNAGWQHSDRAVVLWSPDSRRLATYRQDQRRTSTMTLVGTNVGAPKVEQWKYPFVGDEHVTMIERVIVDLSGAAPRLVRLQMPPDQHRSTVTDDISEDGRLIDAHWSPDARTLAFVSSDRGHKWAQLRVADAATGAVRDVHREEVKTQYEAGHGEANWRILPGSNEFIWFSEATDWGHLYLHDLATGRRKRALTGGQWNVSQIVWFDPVARRVWFRGVGREAGRDPYFVHLYRLDIDDGRVTLLTPENAFHAITVSEDGRHFIDIASTVATAPVTTLRRMDDGRAVAQIARADLSRLRAAGWQPPEPFTVPARDGSTLLYGQMFKPTHFDPNRRYPIVDYVYPGPQTGSVRSRAFLPAQIDHQALAELGFIVVAIDGMGTPWRSKSFHDAYYGNMFDNTIPDQVAGLRALIARHPWIDGERIGIWGHSGGGNATASALFAYPEFFKVGIAEAGNHDNRSYEDDWAERYHGLLETRPDGSTNYDRQDNAAHAANLRGHLLLIHGMMDDNVPPQNTLLVVDALIKANRDFDLLLLPQARHGFGGQTGFYVMRRRWDYFVRHLLGGTPPHEYAIPMPQ